MAQHQLAVYKQLVQEDFKKIVKSFVYKFYAKVLLTSSMLNSLCQQLEKCCSAFSVGVVKVIHYLSRHTVVCHAAQEAVTSHCEYIDRKTKECNFHTYVSLRSLT